MVFQPLNVPVGFTNDRQANLFAETDFGLDFGRFSLMVVLMGYTNDRLVNFVAETNLLILLWELLPHGSAYGFHKRSSGQFSR